MAERNKKSIYINDDNIEYLSEIADRYEKKSKSHIINQVIGIFRDLIFFSTKSKEDYVNVCVPMKSELAELLLEVQRKYGDDAVTELVNLRLLEEFARQIKGGRRNFPDRTYANEGYISKLAEKCKNHLNLTKKVAPF